MLNPHALRQLGSHLIDGFALKTRFDGLVGKNHVGHVAAGSIEGKIHLLRGGTIRQQNIGIFRRRGHMAINDHNHLALFVILEDVMGTVDF